MQICINTADKSFQLGNTTFTTKAQHYLAFEGLPTHLRACANKVFNQSINSNNSFRISTP